MKTGFPAKLCLLLQAISMALCCFVIGNAQTDKKTLILKNCIDLFGSPVDANKSLFEINPLYALELRFDSQGRLNELAFFPKYYFKETYPEWKTPQTKIHLSKAEYESLLGRLDKVKPIGKLIKSMADVKVENFASNTLDQYERAFLDRRIELGGGVRRGSLYFFHEVEGKVRKKRRFNYFIPRDREDYYYQVLAGKLNYFVRKEDYLKLRVGRAAKFSAVGPIEGICVERNCNPLRQHNNSFNQSGSSLAFIENSDAISQIFPARLVRALACFE
jgi:hypothetical protein